MNQKLSQPTHPSPFLQQEETSLTLRENQIKRNKFTMAKRINGIMNTHDDYNCRGNAVGC